MDPFKPEPFGDWFLIDRPVCGVSGEVWTAVRIDGGARDGWTTLHRVRERAGEAGFVERFADEARAACSLRHPNLVQVRDFGAQDGWLYLALERVDGSDLGQVIRQLARSRERMPPVFAAWIVREACKGLHHAHHRAGRATGSGRRVHGAVTAEQVVIGVDGQVRVAGFGLSHAVWRDGAEAACPAPETLDGRPVDGRADVFAIGCLLYELLTGLAPYRGASAEETQERLRAGAPRRVSRIDPSISVVLDAVVMRAVAADPEARFATARDLGDALRAAVWVGADEDAVRHAFSSWLCELLAGELEAERARLQRGEAAVEVVRRAGRSARRAAEDGALRRSRRRGMLAVGSVAVALIAVGLALVALAPPPLPAVPVSGTGGVVVDVWPEARVWVGGTLRGEGTHVEVDGLTPGPWEVRLEADGVAPFVDTVRVSSGGRTRLERTLAAWPAPGGG